MKCLNCKFVEILEHGYKGFIGETVLRCKAYNEIKGEMEDCEDFEDKQFLRSEGDEAIRFNRSV